jgi:hypothetical protein
LGGGYVTFTYTVCRSIAQRYQVVQRNPDLLRNQTLVLGYSSKPFKSYERVIR